MHLGLEFHGLFLVSVHASAVCTTERGPGRRERRGPGKVFRARKSGFPNVESLGGAIGGFVFFFVGPTLLGKIW